MKYRILIISQSAWNDSNSFGNTFSNFFGGHYHNEIANLYCREEEPANSVCRFYFKITERQLIKSFFTRKHAGSYHTDIRFDEKNKDAVREEKFLRFFRKYRFSLFLYLRELIWKLGVWKGKALESFLIDHAPKIIFVIGFDSHYMWDLLFYCRKVTGAKLAVFFPDDIYSYKTVWPIGRIYTYQTRKRILRGIHESDLLYGASPKLCQEYGIIFNKCFKPLFKGINPLKTIVKEKLNNPIRLVYTGNLLYGRWKTLSLIAKTLHKINNSHPSFTLAIYTQYLTNKRIQKAMNLEGTSHLFSKIPFNEVQDVLRNADIVLHVESFDLRQTKVTRFSFSTKIVDCMESGSCLLAIGPIENTSIEYLKDSKSAVVTTNPEEIEQLFLSLQNNPDTILYYAKKMNNFANLNHNLSIIKEMIKNDLEEITKSN